MSTTTFIQSAEAKVKYDGKYSNIEAFNRTFEARLMQRNPLAMAIVKGQIEVKPMYTPLGYVFHHMGAILTNIMLAITIVLTPHDHPGSSNYINVKRTKDEGFNTLYTMIHMHEHQSMEVTVNSIYNTFNNLTSEYEDDEPAGNQPDKKTNDQTNQEPADDESKDDDEEPRDTDTEPRPNEIPGTPQQTYADKTRVRHRGPRLTEQILNGYLDELLTHESQKRKSERWKVGQITASEYIEFGYMPKVSEKHRKEFRRTGIIRTEYITKAVTDINQTIQETVSHKVLQDKRYIRADGRQKNGLDIYKALQTPHDSALVNVIYLNDRINKLTSEEARHPVAYCQKLLQLRQKMDEQLERMTTDLERYELLTIIDTLAKFSNTTEGQAAKQAFLQMDFGRRFKTMEDFKSVLQQSYFTRRSTTTTRRTTINMNTVTTKNGKAVECLACGGNHYLNQCKNKKSIAELKKDKPELFQRYINKPKCKFGKECRKHKEGKCQFRHDDNTTNTNNTIGDAINNHTLCTHSNYTKNKKTENVWILDNGSTKHIANADSQVKNLRKETWNLITQSGHTQTQHVGDIDDDIENVIINPKGSVNIMSEQAYLQKRNDEAFVTIGERVFSVPIDDVRNIQYTYQVAQLNDQNMYELHQDFLTRHNMESLRTNKTHVNNVLPKDNAYLWHCRLGHISPSTMLKMRRNGWIDIAENAIRRLKHKPCKGCQEDSKNKNHSNHPRKDPDQLRATRPETIGHLHGDIAHLTTHPKYKAMTLFVDAKTRMKFAVFDKQVKPDATTATYNIEAINQKLLHTNNKIQSLRFDKESAYISHETEQYMKTIDAELCVNRASEQNLAEPAINTIRQRARKMMNQRNVPKFLTPFAYRYAVQITNLTPTAALGGRTPYQEFYNASPYRLISRLRTFGSVAYYKRPNRTKHEPAEACIYIGLDDMKNGHYLLYSPRTKRQITAHEATFVEVDLPSDWYSNVLNNNPLTNLESGGTTQTTPHVSWQNDDDIIPDLLSASDSNSDSEDEDNTDDDASDDETDYHTCNDDENPQPNEQDDQQNEQDDQQNEQDDNDINEATQRIFDETNETNTNKWSRDTNGRLVRNFLTNTHHKTLIRPIYPKKHEITIPKNRQQMLKHKYAEEWKIAEQIEHDTINEHETIEWIDEPQTKIHKIRTRMVYDIKSDEQGNITKFKARLVVLGYQQRESEYKETYAPVTQWTTILMLMLVGWLKGMEIHVLDFKGAYLHSERPEQVPIYLANLGDRKIPAGKVAKVRKSLYGTVDAGNIWRASLHKLLTELGYQQSKNDPCLYIRKRDNTTTYVATWVDDLIIATNEERPEIIKTEIEDKGFKISLFEKVKKYLGVRWTINKNEFRCDQEEYIEDLLTTANMETCKGIATPMTKTKPTSKDTPKGQNETVDELLSGGDISKEEAKLRRNQIKDEQDEMKNKPYRNIIGSLSHLCRRGRPDIQYAVYYLSRFQGDPGLIMWKAVKRILRYLQRTKAYELKADTKKPLLTVMVDSNLPADPANERPTTGIHINLHGVPIVTKSKVQRLTAKSSTNAELIALCDAVEETIYVKNLLLDFDIDVTPTIYCDSRPAIDTVRNRKTVKGNKHIARRYHFVKDYLLNETVKIEYIPTAENIADMYTKPLEGPAFEKHAKTMIYEKE